MNATNTMQAIETHMMAMTPQEYIDALIVQNNNEM